MSIEGAEVKHASFAEAVKNASIGLFLSEKTADGLTADEELTQETDLVFEGKPYSLRYTITKPDGVIGQARISLVDPTQSEASTIIPPSSTGLERHLRPHELATRVFDIKDGIIDTRITSVSTTRYGFEGQGFSIALGLLSNDIILDLISKRFQKELNGKRVYARIIDFAAPAKGKNWYSLLRPSVKRRGWSGWIAEKLGYTKEPHVRGLPPAYTRVYQEAS